MAADVPLLERIAASAHHDTRFYADPIFPRHLCDGLYSAWMPRSCEGYAEAVLVAESDGGDPIGYITCHIDPAASAGSIGLVAVDASKRGQGIGGALISSTVEWFRARGCEVVQVVPHGRNWEAQASFNAVGFRTTGVGIWLHWWYEAQTQAWRVPLTHYVLQWRRAPLDLGAMARPDRVWVADATTGCSP